MEKTLGARIAEKRKEKKMTQEELAEKLARRGVAVRAGLHCAPLAHESAGTLASGTVRVSFGHKSSREDTDRFLEIMGQIREK